VVKEPKHLLRHPHQVLLGFDESSSYATCLREETIPLCYGFGHGFNARVCSVALKYFKAQILQKNMKMFITGRPGCGKSTLINSIIMQLKEKRISGILSLEIREGKKRVGFMIRDIKSGEKNILASVDMDGPKIGKYGVNLSGLERIVSRFLEGFGNSDVVLIDEIGKMEMLSEKFREAVDIVLNSNKDVVAVVGLGFVDYVRDKGEILVLTRSNFDSIREKILERLK